MTRRLSLQRFVKRLIVFIGLGGLLVFALVWGFRRSLLNPALAREIASQLATMLDATVETNGIDGDPFGEVTLRDVRVTGARCLSGVALDCTASTLRVSLDPLAVGSTTGTHLVTSIAWDIQVAKLCRAPAASPTKSPQRTEVASEIAARLSATVAGLEIWQRHPYRRTLHEPPVIWSEVRANGLTLVNADDGIIPGYRAAAARRVGARAIWTGSR